MLLNQNLTVRKNFLLYFIALKYYMMERGQKMKQQLIKSLQEQIKEADLKNFVISNLSRGDYGYNCVEGVINGEVHLVFRVPYLKDNDKEAGAKILNCFENCKYVIDKILTPITKFKLKKFDDGTLLNYMQVEYQIAEHTFNIHILNCELNTNHHIPPRFFGAEELIKNTIRTIKSCIANFEVLLNTKGFRLEKFEEAEGEGLYYNITGSAYNISNSFTILKTHYDKPNEEFRNVNMKKRMKAELKKFKRLARQPNRPISKIIDLRDYPELFDAYKISEKLSKSSYANEGRKNWKEIFDKGVTYDNDVYAQIIFNTLSKINPKLIFWRTGENFSFKEIFGEEFDRLSDNSLLNRKYDSSKRYCKSEMQGLLETGSQYLIVDDLVFFDGKSNSQRKKELLELGQKPQHNIDNTYMFVRDNNIIINNKNEIVYNNRPTWYNDNNPVSEERELELHNTIIRQIKEAEHRLSYNYKIFKTPQDIYIINSLISIFAMFNGNTEKAKEYKSKSEKIKNIEKDEKLDKLLSTI